MARLADHLRRQVHFDRQHLATAVAIFKLHREGSLCAPDTTRGSYNAAVHVASLSDETTTWRKPSKGVFAKTSIVFSRTSIASGMIKQLPYIDNSPVR
jgi:hypothetical protein